MSFAEFSKGYRERPAEETYTLDEYFSMCRKDPLVYATAAERMVAAIGKPTLVDTQKDERLSRIFTNRTIRVYPAFKDFYGMEETIESIVGYFNHNAQGLEEKKQILEEKTQFYSDQYMNPFLAANRMYVDQIIRPSETRKAICQALDMLQDKEEDRPCKKHGNIPL